MDYRPRWLYSGFAGGTSTLVAKGLPAGTDALGLAGSPVQEPAGGSPETAPNQACRQTYEQATGRKLVRTSNDYVTVMAVCAEVRVFTAGVVNAGPRLSRRTFADGVARIGEVDLAGFGASSFRPGKYDGGDVEQVVRLERTCRCWAPYPGSRPNPAPFA
jgi:hypothetical protein